MYNRLLYCMVLWKWVTYSWFQVIMYTHVYWLLYQLAFTLIPQIWSYIKAWTDHNIWPLYSHNIMFSDTLKCRKQLFYIMFEHQTKFPVDYNSVIRVHKFHTNCRNWRSRLNTWVVINLRKTEMYKKYTISSSFVYFINSCCLICQTAESLDLLYSVMAHFDEWADLKNWICEVY